MGGDASPKKTDGEDGEDQSERERELPLISKRCVLFVHWSPEKREIPSLLYAVELHEIRSGAGVTYTLNPNHQQVEEPYRPAHRYPSRVL